MQAGGLVGVVGTVLAVPLFVALVADAKVPGFFGSVSTGSAVALAV